MLRILACAGVVAGLIGLAACDNGSAEKAGEKLDAAVDEATTGREDKSDGPFEKAGEAVDKATGATNTDAADSLSDAADADKDTRPD